MRLLKFGAKWCAPCKALAKPLEAALTTRPQFELQVVDLESKADNDKDLLKRHRIQAVPTLLLVDEAGKGLRRLVGLPTRKELEAFLDKPIKAARKRKAKLQ
jgi:thioredoxin-like negative regulator of GroEL